jgi:2-oxoglutarate ferredoxin oxidoreductase subunit alpha
VQHLIAVEENATGQLAALAREHGVSADATVLKYDGRPFTPDELGRRVQEVIAP